MADRPPRKAAPETLAKTVVLPDAPRPYPAPAPQPTAPGAKVPPPPMWNYEGADAGVPSAPTPSAADTTADAASATISAQDAEDIAALLDTRSALDELYEQVALLGDLVGRLPE